ncbi:MAG: hypothetical protein WC654_02675 [Patescibacteria group bacterium]
MNRSFILASLFLTLGAGCASQGTDVPMEADVTTAVEEGTAIQEIAIGEPSPAAPAGNGPQNHFLFFATSVDGTAWNLGDEAIAAQASVPDLVALTQDLGSHRAGTLITYFVDASDFAQGGEERIGFLSSTDNGKTWSARSVAKIDGLPDGVVAVDPSVVQLPDDGRLRLYFYDIAEGRGQEIGSAAAQSTIYSAVSSDGETFAFEGKVYRRSGITDPEVVLYNDTWYLFAAAQVEGGVDVAVSQDGTSFDDRGTVKLNGIPGSVVDGNQLKVFGCGRSGITSSTMQGYDGTEFGSSRLLFEAPVCDPDPAILSDGTYAMVMKGFAASLNAPTNR